MSQRAVEPHPGEWPNSSWVALPSLRVKGPTKPPSQQEAKVSDVSRRSGTDRCLPCWPWGRGTPSLGGRGIRWSAAASCWEPGCRWWWGRPVSSRLATTSGSPESAAPPLAEKKKQGEAARRSDRNIDLMRQNVVCSVCLIIVLNCRWKSHVGLFFFVHFHCVFFFFL